MPNAAQPTTVEAMTPTMAQWDEQFRLFGSVRFGQNALTVVVVLLMLLAAMVAGAYFGIRDSGSVDAAAIVISLIIVAIIAVPALYFFVSFRQKAVTVGAEGVRLTNGLLIPWDGVEFAGVWSSRSNHSVALALTDEAMQDYKARQSGAARALTRASDVLISSNTVFLPTTLDANPEEFAAWMNTIIDAHRPPSQP